MLDAYLNFLIGKGSGTGWDLREEVKAAVACVERKNPVVFDVGANVGDWTKYFLDMIPGTKAYLFDPSPGCQAAIRAKNLPGAIIMPYAVGEQAGTLPYFSSSPTDGSASLHVRRDTPFQDLSYEESKVEVQTLDGIMERERIDFVDFMKMDIEGHELFALKGASRALREGRIGALSFEFGCGNINSRTFFRDFYELLTGAGYQIYRITAGGRTVPVDSYYEDDEYFRGATNFLARRKPSTG